MPLSQSGPAWRPEPWSLAGFAGLHEEVDDLRFRVSHLSIEDLDPAVQRVVDPQGQDRDADADGRGDEGLRDASGDRADAARAGQLHAAERVDDAEDRSEQADEGGRRGDGGHDGQAAAELLIEQGLSPFGAARGGLELLFHAEMGFFTLED